MHRALRCYSTMTSCLTPRRRAHQILIGLSGRVTNREAINRPPTPSLLEGRSLEPWKTMVETTTVRGLNLPALHSSQPATEAYRCASRVNHPWCAGNKRLIRANLDTGSSGSDGQKLAHFLLGVLDSQSKCKICWRSFD